MLSHLIIALSMAGLTWTLGWWGVVVAAAVLGFVYREERGRAWRVGLAAMEGWALLLLVDLVLGPLGLLTTTLQGVMNIPGPALLLVTLLFPGLLGWSTAAVVSEVASLRRPALPHH